MGRGLLLAYRETLIKTAPQRRERGFDLSLGPRYDLHESVVFLYGK